MLQEIYTTMGTFPFIDWNEITEPDGAFTTLLDDQPIMT